MNTDRFKTSLPSDTEIERFTRDEARAVRETLEQHNASYNRGMLHGDRVENWGAAKEAAAVLRKLTAAEYRPLSAAEQQAEKADRLSPEQRAEALHTIGFLKGDPEFWRRFRENDRHAVDAWNSAHQQAYGDETVRFIELAASGSPLK